jgi:phosphoribosylformylglycinamidine synthase
VGLNPCYSDLDPYAMAAAAIDEALRNLVAVGASLERCAILDNYCWGNCDKPDRLGGLVRASKACLDVGLAYGVPFVSGKDSLNNEFATPAGTVVIPGTLLISAMAVMQDVRRAVTMDLKEPGSLLYLVGRTRDELGGSHFYRLHGELGANVPVVRPGEGRAVFNGLNACTERGLVRSLHDLSEGGLAVAAAEMAFAGGFGAEIRLGDLPVGDGEALSAPAALFSESQSRLLAEVAPGNAEAVEAELRRNGAAFACVGRVMQDRTLRCFDAGGTPVVEAGIDGLKKAWQGPLAL